MLLPESFSFTQQNLQDYVDCQFRFYLRQIKKLEWPAVESEPILAQEELMQLGTRFHLLCQQFFSGIPAEVLSALIIQPELAVWWENFLQLDLKPDPGHFRVEQLVSLPFAGFRLAAKFDLLLEQPNGKTIIYDWKTSQHQPKRLTLLERMQSKVYPLVISLLNSKKHLTAEFIEMIYWYPAFPATPIRFTYSATQQDADQSLLEHLISEISGKDEKDFTKTEKEKACSFCRFRSLCNRGSTAGIQEELDDLAENEDAFNLDFELA